MIAFDLDDTLYKERDFLASGRRAVTRKFAASLGLKPEELYDLMMVAADPFDCLVERSGGTISIPQILDTYRNHLPEIALDRSTEYVLKTLKDRGEQLAIITDGRAVTQRNKIAALGLERFVDSEAIIVSEEIGAEKTSPLPFQILMQRFPAAAPFTYVGDNPAKDFIHPRQLGWRTVMLADTHCLNIHPQHLTNPNVLAATTIDTLDALLG